MNWNDALIVHLLAPLCGGLGGLSLGMLLLSIADHLARKPRTED